MKKTKNFLALAAAFVVLALCLFACSSYPSEKIKPSENYLQQQLFSYGITRRFIYIKDVIDADCILSGRPNCTDDVVITPKLSSSLISASGTFGVAAALALVNAFPHLNGTIYKTNVESGIYKIEVTENDGIYYCAILAVSSILHQDNVVLVLPYSIS